jgi:hypothetical protein
LNRINSSILTEYRKNVDGTMPFDVESETANDDSQYGMEARVHYPRLAMPWHEPLQAPMAARSKKTRDQVILATVLYHKCSGGTSSYAPWV